MTGATGNCLVLAIERKFGLRVIITCLTPALDSVAEFAAIFGDKFIELSLVRIFMTGKAAGTLEFEFDCLNIPKNHFLFMAGIAGYRQMATL